MSAVPEDRRLPHPARLSPRRRDYDRVMAAHDAACAAGRVGYLDPGTRLFVLTVDELWARGSCCDSGCRHCPYVERP